MKSIFTATLAAVTLLSTAANAQVAQGCFDSIDPLVKNSTDTFNSIGYCSTQCRNMGKAAFGTNYKDCYCGDTFPAKSAQTDNSSCTITCPGYKDDGCGGSGTYNIYTSGLTTDVAFADGSSGDSTTATKKTSASATATAKPSVVTVGGQTVVVTASSSSTNTDTIETSKSSSPSKAGIAAGVVVGIVAIAAIAGGIFLFIRNRRRRAVEEEYRRNAAVSDFIAGGAGKPPHSSGGDSSFTDTRLDPAVMAQRRMSDGSIADNQDYSRRILKVTNA